ncbi:SAICAR synthase-like protein [Meredithblackwellia eburnea MCA 4105]
MGETNPVISQVGGHPNTIQASPLSSSTLIKPSLPVERNWYQQVGPSLHPDYIGVWTPAFFGTLKLEGKMDDNTGKVEKISESGDEMIVLENLTYRFLRPNILDIKLGTQLFDEDASPEKQERMRAAAANTTSGSHGVRLTGFQVWDTTSSSYIATDKTFGKSLKPVHLPAGIAKFFGSHLFTPSSASSTSPDSDTALPSTGQQPDPAPLPNDLLLPVLSLLLSRLEELIALFSTFEVRIRGGSILIVVEGDPVALRSSLERLSTPPEDEKDEEDGVEDDDVSEASTSDSQGEAKEHTRLPIELRMIDFAHATKTEGQGPDKGVLLGMRTTRDLIKGLLERCKELVKVEEEAGK